jgi:predicted transcriptional regulator
MDFGPFLDALDRLSKVSVYAVLLLIIGFLGWALWKAVNRIAVDKDGVEDLAKNIAKALDAHNAESARNNEMMARNNEIMTRNNEMMERSNATIERNSALTEQVLKFTENQAEWLRSTLAERLSQEQSLARLEQYSRTTVEKIDEVRDTVKAISALCQFAHKRND